MTRSDMYGAVQTTLLVLFNAVFFLLPGPTLVDVPTLRAVSTIVCAVALALLLVALITLRRVIQVAPAPKAGGQLIAAGIYGVLRHPIYTAMALLVAGLWLRRPTLAVAVMGAVVIAFLLRKARYEEALLAAHYPGYADYRARTRGVLLTR